MSAGIEPMTKRRSLLMQWVRDHLSYPHEEYCLMWPFARHVTGYCSIGRDGKNTYVHRVMCELVNGPPPTPKHHAAHSCDRGTEGCVNPRHLSWKTNAENQRERKPWAGRVKLAPEQVAEIRGLKDLERVADTAARFGVSEVNVRQIQAGKIWRQDRGNFRHLTDAEVLAIRRLPKARGVFAAEAKRLGIGRSTVHGVYKRQTYRHVPEEMSQSD